MFRLFLLTAALASLVVAMGSGCSTNEPVIWSYAHNKRHALTIVDGLGQTWDDIDRIFFNMENYPDEPVGERFLREGKSITYGLHRFHVTVDDALFDMPEYPLESER